MTEFTCAHCGEPSSQQGHYMAGPRPCPNGGTSGMLDEQGRRLVLGFNCRLGHACLPVRVPAELAAPPPDSLEEWAEDGRKLRLGWIIEYDRLHDEHRKTHDPHTEGKMDQLDLCLQGLDALLARARALGVGKP